MKYMYAQCHMCTCNMYNMYNMYTCVHIRLTHFNDVLEYGCSNQNQSITPVHVHVHVLDKWWRGDSIHIIRVHVHVHSTCM